MTINEAIELFQAGKVFKYEGKIYEIKNAKKVTNNFVLLTDKRTFNFWEIELKIFVESVEFISGEQMGEMLVEAKNPAPAPVVMSDSLKLENYWLPKSSMRAKDALDSMLDIFSNPKNISKEMIEKADALCKLSDKIVSVEKLQLDYVRFQKNKS